MSLILAVLASWLVMSAVLSIAAIALWRLIDRTFMP